MGQAGPQALMLCRCEWGSPRNNRLLLKSGSIPSPEIRSSPSRAGDRRCYEQAPPVTARLVAARNCSDAGRSPSGHSRQLRYSEKGELCDTRPAAPHHRVCVRPSRRPLISIPRSTIGRAILVVSRWKLHLIIGRGTA